MPDLDALDAHVLLVVAVAFILIQTAVVLGFLVPAGKAAVLAGILAGAGELDLVLTYVSLAVAATAGATLNYLLGRWQGTRLFEHRLLAKHHARIEQARDLVHRRAGVALLAGRSVAVLRATTPALAGACGVGWRRFAFFNVLGALLWALVFVGTGYAGGRFVPGLDLDSSALVLTVAAVVLLAGLAVAAVRRPAPDTP